MRFQNRTALVTGGASGIGRATALKLAGDGARVVLADIDEEGARAVADQCGGEAIVLACDVTDGDAIDSAFDRIAEECGRLDILVNNAGAGGSQVGIAEFDLAGWDATMSLLLRSAAICTHRAVGLMETGGAIVNVASVAAFSAGYSPLAYAVAKAGLMQFTKVTAAELAHRGIRVNAVCPGMIVTGIYSSGFKNMPNAAAMIDTHMRAVAPNAQPLKLAGLPEHVADSICHLASDASAFVTGAHLLVDGGMLVGPRHSWDPETWAARQKDRERLYEAAAASG